MNDDKPPKGKPGRPTLPVDQRLSERLEVRLTPTDHAKAITLGGADWVRERIKRAKVPRKE